MREKKYWIIEQVFIKDKNGASATTARDLSVNDYHKTIASRKCSLNAEYLTKKRNAYSNDPQLRGQACAKLCIDSHSRIENLLGLCRRWRQRQLPNDSAVKFIY